MLSTSLYTAKTHLKTTSLFWLLSCIDIIGILLGQSWLHSAVKPLLMPVLAYQLLTLAANNNNRKLMLAGIVLCWMGDILLIFETYNALFFIAGLSAFLLAHTCYITFFFRIRKNSASLVKRYPALILIVLGYCLGLFALLLPGLGAVKIPVLIYAVVIGTMLVGSLHVYKKLNKPAAQYFLGGALLFVGSDSVLAINKFYLPFAGAAPLIMLSYCAAQFFIVHGFIAYANDERAIVEKGSFNTR